MLLNFVEFILQALPKRFSDSLKRKLPDNATLRGPGGAELTVKLSTKDDILHFTNGWQQFAHDHFLEENDLLIFKYNGESQFDVLIFDQKNLCEKVASYFVRDSVQTNNINIDNVLDEEIIPSNMNVNVAWPEKSAHGKSKKTTKKARKTVVETTPPQPTKRRGRSRGSDAHDEEIQWVPGKYILLLFLNVKLI